MSVSPPPQVGSSAWQASFFFANKCLPIHAATLQERPLGGVDTGVIKLAEKLQQRGHEVAVYTTHKDPPPSVPCYVNVSKITECTGCDVFVTVKDWQPLFFNIPCRCQLYLTGESFAEYSTYGIGDKRVVDRLHCMLTKSDWHSRTLCEASGFPLERARAIGNGLELSDFEGEEPRSPKRLIYSSAPYRGLELVPALFQELLKHEPQAELHVFSGLNVYDTDKPFSGPKFEQHKAICERLSRLPNVHLHGNVLQRELAREFMRSAVLFYPNIWLETNCRTVLEAQAAGCPIVTSAAGALPETVGDAGILIPGDPGSPEYVQEFVKATARLLKNKKLWERLSVRGKERARRLFTWDAVADRFEEAVRAVLR